MIGGEPKGQGPARSSGPSRCLFRVVSVREAASGKLTFGRAVRGGRRPMPEPAAEPERSALRQPSPESQSARVECAGCVIEFTPAGGDQIEGHAVRVEARNPALVA